jgi:hypothetical protein
MGMTTAEVCAAAAMTSHTRAMGSRGTNGGRYACGRAGPTASGLGSDGCRSAPSLGSAGRSAVSSRRSPQVFEA